MTLRVFEAFSGIGTQRMALRNLGIEHEVVAIAEIDKYAIASYEAIHGEVNNLGDISKIKTEDIPDHDLFTYSFPCQDISVAGKQAGLKEGSGTRSGLLWECEKVIEVKRPKYLLMENVKNLVGKKFKADFDKWLERLEELGYSNYWQVLNAKDYGIPQNRERVFCVSILGEHTPYDFPKGFELKLRLKDILEDEVEEKFYLSKEQVEKIKFSNFNQEKKRLQEKEYSDTLLARDYKDPKVVRVGGIFDKENQTHQAGSIYDKEQLAPTIDTMQGGWRQPSVLIKNGTKKGYLEAVEGDGIDLAYVNSENRRGRGQSQMIQTLDTTDNKGVVVKPYSDKSMEKIKANIRDVEGLSTIITANPQRATIDNGNLVIIGSTQKHAAVNKEGIVPTLTSAMGMGGGHVPMFTENKIRNKENLIIESKEEFGRMGKQAIETFNENNLEHGDTINPFNKKPSSENGISPTLTTRPEGFKTAISVVDQFRIRKLTPKECWRLMGCSDEDFEKAAYELRKIIFKGGNESWNVKLADVTENQTHENMETFALNIIKDLKGQEEILTEWIKSLKMPENEKEQNVNVVIEKLGELEHLDSATSIIKCTDYMEILTILMEEKDPLHKVIIELDPKVSASTAKYMKITSEESLNPLKLSIILTLIEQITESKIFISTLRKVNICGHISVTENLLSNTENQIELSLKTEAMFTRISASQLYKQAGNAIVVDVLENIFNCLFKGN